MSWEEANKDMAVYQATLDAQLAAGVDRKIAEGRARSKALRAWREAHPEEAAAEAAASAKPAAPAAAPPAAAATTAVAAPAAPAPATGTPLPMTAAAASGLLEQAAASKTTAILNTAGRRGMAGLGRVVWAGV